MKFLPIVDRELRVAARRWATFWLRTWVAMTVIGVSAWIVLVNSDERPSDVSGYLFYTVTGGAMLYCLLIGLSATADCLSEEKREGTLGLLFLTDLKGFDVVAGKLAANSLNCFYGLLAMIPVMALPLLMGGITGAQFGSAATALVNAMFFSLAIGMFASACCRSRRKAVLLTFGIIMLIAVLIPGVTMWCDRSGVLPLQATGCLCSPLTALLAPLDFGVWTKDWRVFAESVAAVHFVAWIFLLLACLVAPRSWQDRPAGATRGRWSERWTLWSQGNADERQNFRRRILDDNAFFWLAARERLKPMWVWVLLGFVCAAWAWGYGKFQRDWFNEVVFIFTAILLNLLLKCWFAAEAVKTLAEERRTGSLELLLVTGLTPREILQGQGMALRRQFLWPVFVLLAAEIAMMLAGSRSSVESGELVAWMLWWGVGLFSFVADLMAIYWVGMWLGLSSSNVKRAYVATVGAVLILPCIAYALFLMILFALAVVGRSNANLNWKVCLGIWFLLNLSAQLGFGLWARSKLLKEFRETATQRYQWRASWWGRLRGKGSVT